ncbi:MAG: peptidoglycan DD-metalloendopeptidase family protein, partial [Luteimonas sp.]|nr:peptidoglycan DD-metalloendopeptidase family protein [Luteimonas sp.]
MLRVLLLLLVGVLVGANIVYFAMSRGQGAGAGHAPAATVEAVTDDPAAIGPADAPVQPVERLPVAVSASPDVADVAVSKPAAPGTPATTPPRPAAPTAGKPPAAGPSWLIVPVQGIAAKSLLDTYTDARSEGRSHDAIDIMAPAATPVLAAADGHVEKLFTSDRGGLTIYQFEPGGQHAYYYAHLQSYAPGLHEKQQLRQGE